MGYISYPLILMSSRAPTLDYSISSASSQSVQNDSIFWLTLGRRQQQRCLMSPHKTRAFCRRQQRHYSPYKENGKCSRHGISNEDVSRLMLVVQLQSFQLGWAVELLHATPLAEAVVTIITLTKANRDSVNPLRLGFIAFIWSKSCKKLRDFPRNPSWIPFFLTITALICSMIKQDSRILLKLPATPPTPPQPSGGLVGRVVAQERKPVSRTASSSAYLHEHFIRVQLRINESKGSLPSFAKNYRSLAL